MPSPTVPGLRHLIPVLSSTASVSFRLSEYWTLIPFLRDDIPPQSLARFWESFLYRKCYCLLSSEHLDLVSVLTKSFPLILK